MHRRQRGNGRHAAQDVSTDPRFRAAVSSDRPQADTIDEHPAEGQPRQDSARGSP